MTESEVRARILTFADASGDPPLTSDDVSVCISLSKRIDTHGTRPSGSGWTETYNVNHAIAQAWLIKASRLSGHYMFMSGGKMFARNQMFDHCMSLCKKFASRAGIQAIPMGPYSDGLNDIPLLGNWNANSC